MVGTVEEFKTESDAQNAVDALRLTINEQTPRQQLKEICFETLVQHCRQHEMPDIFYKKSGLPEEIAEDENRKSYATQDTYQGYLRKWILPRWKSYRLPDVKSVQVEQWLKSLTLAPGSKAKIRNIMSAIHTRSSVVVRTELAADLPEIIADRVQLQQVFMNLMLNAIEAMKDAAGELTVKSERQDGQLQFSVSDTGVGLPTEMMDQIFSAFFTTKPQGSGMGLAISRTIVESHGGRLWAIANDERGATFHFTIPIQDTESPPLVA
ncbi:MAG: ATP-binding protein [Candidatus Sulfotelmatobacter sp.]